MRVAHAFRYAKVRCWMQSPQSLDPSRHAIAQAACATMPPLVAVQSVYVVPIPLSAKRPKISRISGASLIDSTNRLNRCKLILNYKLLTTA